MLGNKRARQHNVKTVYFKETIVSGIYHRKVAANSFVAMVGLTPYKLFLKVPWVNKQLASSDFTFMKR